MRIRNAVIVMIVTFGICSFATAGEGYVGASYMNSTAEFETLSGTIDPSSSGWKIFGGYNLIKYFGVELTYYDLGSYSESSDEFSLDSDIEVFDLAARGILPLGERFALFARLGYSSVQVDVREQGLLGSVSADGTDWRLLYGIGVGLKLGKRFGIRAEWESWDVETSLDAWSVGAVIRFGGN